MSERQRNNSRIPGRPLACLAAVGVAVGVAAGLARPARADGAFPEAQAILLPRDRPNEIIVATTFGLVSTDNDGSVWHLSCEAVNTPMIGGGRYAMGPPPEDRIYAKTDVGVALSTNDACGWSIAGGALSAAPTSMQPMPFDISPDPSDPTRVFVLANDAVSAVTYAYRSLDAGATYFGPIFTSADDTPITGIEASASVPGVVYSTLYQRSVVLGATGVGTMLEIHPRFGTSLDGGDTWTIADVEPSLGNVTLALAAVDPEDSRKIYLRVTSAAGAAEQYQGIAITVDAGMTWTIPLKVPKGSLVGFARLSAQTLLAVGRTAPPAADQSPAPVLFRSDDGGQTFVTEPAPFHPLGLAQRDGTAFVVTEDPADGFALTSSSDGGHTWTRRLRFRDIRDVKDCVRSSCSDACDMLAGSALFPAEVCTANQVTMPPKTGGGCGCRIGEPLDVRRQFAWSTTILVAICLIRRRRALPLPSAVIHATPAPENPPAMLHSRATPKPPKYPDWWDQTRD